MRDRVRRLTDLFVDGRAIALPDGTYLWVQVINSYQREECIGDAQAARARLVMALRHDGAERLKIEALLEEHGRQHLIERLAYARANAKQNEYINEMRSDPDWKERIQIIERTDPLNTATPLSPEEVQLLDRINQEVLLEMNRRETDERDFQTRKLDGLNEDELVEEYVDHWLDRRGTELAGIEFRLTEMAYATRFCEAALDDNGELHHNRCDGHLNQVFENKNEARSAPNRLQALIREALDELNMQALDPKGSAKPGSSSGSPPTPSAAEESTPSTSMPTPAAAPGT